MTPCHLLISPKDTSFSEDDRLWKTIKSPNNIHILEFRILIYKC